MALRFTVLASGSAGNVNVLHTASSAIFLDVGLQRSILVERLASAGLSHLRPSALLLTHTHGDHWNDSALSWLDEQGADLYCHPSHHSRLERSSVFRALLQAGRVRDYLSGTEFSPAPGWRALSVPVRHDGGATFAFRIQGPSDLFGAAPVVGHLTDLGIWDDELVERFHDVDLLALEFNHDLDMERRSPRPAYLIQRVIGDHGHLSNCQAAAFLRAALERGSGRLQHLVQLHLSTQCNRPSLARQAARDALAEFASEARIHTASQKDPLRTIEIRSALPTRNRSARGKLGSTSVPQPLLPGLEG